MQETKDICLPEQHVPDGGFDVKFGQTKYKVKVFFDHEGEMSAEDRLKRVIMIEARKQEK